MSRNVAEDEHQSMGRVDGRIARWRGWVRVRPSPEQVSQVQRQGTRSVLENDTLLLSIRLFGVSWPFFFFFFSCPPNEKKKNHYPGERNETNEIISNEWVELLSRIKVCVLQLRYNGKEKILFKKTKLIPSCLFPMKILLSYDIVISYRDDLKIF